METRQLGFALVALKGIEWSFGLSGPLPSGEVLAAIEEAMRLSVLAFTAYATLGPPLLSAQTIPLDLTTGYIFNVPGDRVPFRGAITASFNYRLSRRFVVGVPAGYVWADSADAFILGGQVAFRLVGELDDANVAFLVRAAGAPAGTSMVPITAGLIVTALGVRTGVLVTRDLEREATALELLLGIDVLAIGDLIDAFAGGGS
jgi:hypothetical protein